MNKHFEDALYYARRAGDHLYAGLAEEADPLTSRVRARLGWEKEPEPSRLERIQAELREIEQRAEGESRRAARAARERLQEFRGESSAEGQPSD